jgi:hypothetical protein
VKRDWDLIREILFELERAEPTLGWVELDFEGHTPLAIAEHIRLVGEAGLVEVQPASSMGSYEWHAKRLTWEGHEFLNDARSDTVWKRAKELVAEKVGVT